MGILKNTAACILAAGMLAASGANAQTGGPDERTRFEYAANLFMQGASDSSVKELTNFVKDFPKGEYSDDAYYLLGKHYMATGRKTDALDQFRIILALMPDSGKAPGAQFEMAAYWYDPSNPDRDLERAVAEFLKIPFFYQDSPQADDAAYYGALCQMEQNNLAQAQAEFAAFVAKYPDSEYAAPAGFKLGLSYWLSGMTADALAALQSVTDTHPAGLYANRASSAASLIIRARDKAPLRPGYTSGAKGDAPGQFVKPQDVAFAPSGFVYVSDTGNSRVQRFKLSSGRMEPETANISSATLEKELRLDEPAGIAVGPGGKVYVADAGLDRIQVFGPDGTLLLTFGKRGDAPSDLRGPSGIAVDAGGYIFVADTGNKRVAMFGPDGRFIRAIGSQSANSVNALKSPVGVAVGIKGNIIVTDNSLDRVMAYSREGELTMMYGEAKNPPVALKDPSGICVDQAGNVYVSDPGTYSVVMFDSSLTPLSVYPGKEGKVLDKPGGLAVSYTGEVFVSDTGANSVAVLK